MRMTFPNWPKDKRPVIHYHPGQLIFFALLFMVNTITFINSKRTPDIKEWDSHTSNFYGYHINYPENWAKYDLTITGTEHYPDSRTLFTDTGFIPDMSLRVFHREIDDSTLAETAVWGTNIMTEYWLEPSNISDVEVIEVNGYSALTRTYEIRSKPQTMDYRDVYVVAEDKAFVLKFGSEPDYFETANQYFFEPMLDSFVILDE